MSERVTRRRFLTGALGAGAAAVAAPAVRALAMPARTTGAPPPAGLTRPPGEPPAYQTFVSRPDLRPPGTWILSTPQARAATEPAYIFATAGSGVSAYPAGAQKGLMIFDRLGHLVFFRPLQANNVAPFNFRVQTFQGKPALTWFEGTLGPGFGIAGNYSIADDTYKTIHNVSEADGVPCDLHEFLITPQDTALHTGYAKLTGKDLYSGYVFERDILTGAVLFKWSSYPAVPVSRTYLPGNADYFHINSIDQWPGSDRNLLISSRHTNAVYLIERSSGNILWIAGGKASTFDMVGAATRFEYQHDARALADGSGFSIFDDGAAGLPGSKGDPPTPEKQAWIKTLAVDTTTKKVTIVEQNNHSTEPIVVPYEGNNQLLPNGNRFVGWGGQNWFSEFAGHEMILDGRWPAGVGSYRVYSNDWVASPPPKELAFVVHKGSQPGAFTGYVSWNGATEVAFWQIWGGPTWQERAQVSRHGFETAIPFHASGATNFRAYAHDAAGKLIGVSKDVAAT